jgi:hypothetical protein
MKKIFIFISIAILSLNLVFSWDMSDKAAETFLLVKDSPIFLSFENYKMKDGRTPVVLSIDRLRFLLWLDASGSVSERRKTKAHPVEPVCTLDPSTLSLGIGKNKLYFEVYEQNSVRTRWRLSPSQEKTTGTLTKKILFQRSGIVLYLGNIQLQLRRVYRKLREISPGLFRMQLNGPMVMAHPRLVYEKETGTIYSIPPGNDGLIPHKKHTWAIRRMKSDESCKLKKGGN